MSKLKRQRCGLAGSLLLHLVVVLVLAVTGILHSGTRWSDVTEITFMGGGGGGAEAASVNSAMSAAAAAPAVQETEVADGIAEQVQEVQQVTAPVRSTAVTKSAVSSSAATAASSNTGTGNGRGGSGTGYGKGSGSGSGSGEGEGSGSGNGIYSNPAVPPKIVRAVSPVYPETQRLTDVKGVVYLQLLIGSDGRVEQVTVLESSGSVALDNAAVKACRQWRFKAAKNAAGQAVRCYWNIPVRFDLKH